MFHSIALGMAAEILLRSAVKDCSVQPDGVPRTSPYNARHNYAGTPKAESMLLALLFNYLECFGLMA
jgi:hypothetical protein